MIDDETRIDWRKSNYRWACWATVCSAVPGIFMPGEALGRNGNRARVAEEEARSS